MEARECGIAAQSAANRRQRRNFRQQTERVLSCESSLRAAAKELRAAAQILQLTLFFLFFNTNRLLTVVQCAKACRTLLIYSDKLRSLRLGQKLHAAPKTEFANRDCYILGRTGSCEKCGKGKRDCIREEEGESPPNRRLVNLVSPTLLCEVFTGKYTLMID